MSGPPGSLRERVVRVFGNVFDNPGIVLAHDTTPDDVPGWDSLGTVSLLYALEAEFDVEIDDDDVAALGSVGAIEDYLSTRTDP